jgi:membrane-associated phospholipid phosphatase
MVRYRALWRGCLGVAAGFWLVQVPALAAPPDRGLERAGTAVAIALPVAAAGISLLHHRDWNGLGEFAVSTGLTVGTALLLKQVVRERRPDHSDFHSFPSETSALADASADYLWSRYGWQYGVPAFLASSFVGYTRTDAKKHHWYDVTASGAIAFAFNYAIVTRYHPGHRYSLYASAEPGGMSVHLAMNF